MNDRTVKWRTLWRWTLHGLLLAGLVIEGFGLIRNNTAQQTNGSLLIATAAILLLWSWSDEHRERLNELERREQQRFQGDLHYASVVSDLMDSAARRDPAYVEARARRKRNDDYAKTLRGDQ